MSLTDQRVLCLLFDGVEELELVAPVDLLRRAGLHVTLASLSTPTVIGRSGIAIAADALIDALDISTFDVLLIPGGPGIAAVRAEGRAASFAAEFAEHGKWIAAICAAPLVLHDAKLLEGKNFCAHGSAHELLSYSNSQAVVIDGRMVTSMGAGTAIEFGLALIEQLLDQDAAAEVAQAIHWQSPNFLT